ncbi:MAG: hypothetical protein E7352_03715 [Clostridiales bacterium]|nr:hypothetical protein [Clostridiales bacterium]
MHEHDGHRTRLREKLDKGALQDHEYLELLLCTAMPRRNTNDIAHRLLSQFGSVTGVFSADYADLIKVKGVGEGVAGFLVSLGKLVEKYYRRQTAAYRGIFETNRFISYLKENYKDERREVLDVYFLDENKFVFAIKSVTNGGVDRAEFDPMILTQLLVELKPAGLVLVHNHPNGSYLPSAADDETTGKCQILCSYHNVVLCDHLICAKEGVYSYLNDKKLEKISKKYSVQNLIKE